MSPKDEDPMQITFAHYRNRFCMYRTYYALAKGIVRPDGFTMKVIELPDPPRHEQEDALIRGDVQVANLYLPNLRRKLLARPPIVGLHGMEATMKGNGMFVRKDGPVRDPRDLVGRVIGSIRGRTQSTDTCCGTNSASMMPACSGSPIRKNNCWRH